MVPSGASIGIYESETLELSDGGSNYLGKDVSKVRNYIFSERIVIRFLSYLFFFFDVNMLLTTSWSMN